jgi:tRNA 2-selenouridine synthase
MYYNFEQPFNLKILGGYTGTGKTEITFFKKKDNKWLIWKDWLIIEVRLWWDRPSATANNEQFQNNLFSIVQSLNPTLPIWVEDESMLIGQVAIPDAFYTTMREMPVYFLFLWRKEQNTLLPLASLSHDNRCY